MLTNIASPVAAELNEVESILARESSAGVTPADDCARHVIQSGGKRLRPALFLLAVRMAQPEGEPAPDRMMLSSVAAGLELLHTASLLHDDVVDEGSQRRGTTSANAVFGNAASVLVGDFLWCAASRLILGARVPQLTDAVVDAVRTMAVGALREVAVRTSTPPDRETWLEILQGKTAALFALCGRAGAIVAQAPPEHEQALRCFGLNVGMAFQLRDDVLDAASDIDARHSIEILGGAAAALGLAREYADRACHELKAFPPSADRDALMAIADYAASRRS